MRLKRCLVEKTPNKETVEKKYVSDIKEDESEFSRARSTILESDDVSLLSFPDKSDIFYNKDKENVASAEINTSLSTNIVLSSKINRDVGKDISEASPTILESEDVSSSNSDIKEYTDNKCITSAELKNTKALVTIPTSRLNKDLDKPKQLIVSTIHKSITETDLADVLNVELDENEFATMDVWDFAGDRQFYNTHQTFLSKEALYIVTADMTKDVESILGIDGGKKI